jgi:signal transduction histidine kinase
MLSWEHWAIRRGLNVDADFASFFVAAGAAAIGIAALLWAMRVTDGARGALNKWKDRARDLEDTLARVDAVFGAHPGVVLIWDESAASVQEGDWGSPQVLGSSMALASLLRFAGQASASEPALRILQGLSGFEARDATDAVTRLGPALTRLRRDGAAFSLTISTAQGVYVEVDGRTAGARAVVWIVDAGLRGVAESGPTGRIDGADRIIARDPASFLEMLAHAPFLAWRTSSAGKLEWANSAYLTALDAKTLEQAIGRNLALDQAAAEHARIVVETGEARSDVRKVVINGELRTMRIQVSAVAGGAAGMAFDVTDSEGAKEQLSRQARAHDETLNHLAEGVAVFGADKRLIFHNRAFEEMWGLDPAVLAERPTHAQWLDHLKERRRLPAHANYAEWRANELALYQESKLPEALWVVPDGRTLRIVRQRHPHGGLLLIFSDITNELTLRTQYNALLQVQKAALDRLHEGVAVFGLDGRLKLSNASFATMWGHDPALVQAEAPFDDIVERCQPLFHDRAVWAMIRARITDPSPEARQEYRGEMRRSDESVLTFLTRPLPDGATLIAFMDMTAARRVEEALRDRAEAFEAADRLKTEFVQNVSYQLRNPLQAIHGNAEMLAHRLFGPLNDRQEDQVGSILDGSTRLTKLIDNILDVALVEAGEVTLDLSDIDLKEAIQDSIEMATTKASDTEVHIKVDCADTVGSIHADEKRIRQILFNLLTNALRYTERGDEITVGAERLDGVVRLWVSDTGRGIPFDEQVRAFESFEGSDRRGAGLGLALVRSFVQLHGGWVAMNSEPGRGTTVTCHLPVEAPLPLAAE